MKFAWMAVTALALGTGCQNEPPQSPLQAQQFAAAPAAPAPAKTQGPAQAPAQASAQVSAQPSAKNSSRKAASPAPTLNDAQVVPPVNPDSTVAPPTAAKPATQSTGVYLIVGTVLAEANGQPIFAEKVVAKLEPELATKARQLGPKEFRALAATRIREKIGEEVSEELEIASAQRNTTDDEQQMAKELTRIWRTKEITKAGGAQAVARKLALDNDGIDFDEKSRIQYRSNLLSVYYYRHVWPQVQVSADDMRAFYNLHLKDMFTETAAVRFQAIKFSVARRGTREKALDEANNILAKAKRGEDFGELAHAFNDDSGWANNYGFMQMKDVKRPDGTTVREPAWYDAGTLRQEKLEKELFALNAGELTEAPIDEKDAFYIAKVVEKKKGIVQDFQDQSVQDRIRDILTKSQRQELRIKQIAKLNKAAVVRTDERQVETALEMVMQKYAVWSRN